MKILKILSLRGPNIWANFPVLEAWVDLEELKDSPSDQLPGFNDRLMAWLPTMIEHRCSIGERGGFFERLRRGTRPGHILEHVTLELQSLAGSTVGYGRARETSQEGVYKVVVESLDETFGTTCLEAGLELVLAAIHDRPYDVKAEVARLSELNQTLRLGPSTRAIAAAAARRGIPLRRLNDANLVQLGYGANQRRILAGETDRTGAIAESIAQDKDLTRSLLKSIGVPVPEGRAVTDENDAWDFAQEIGGPVVVKPRYGNQGRGVAVQLTRESQVRAAYAVAKQEDSSVMVEQFIAGGDHRLLVVGDKLVAAARREPAHVLGDGAQTVAELVRQVNADPRRGNDHTMPLSRIPLDSIALGVLSEQQLTPESIPRAGVKVLLRRNGNLSTGGAATDVTDLVHPEVAARAIDAARMVGLDIAGIDILAADIGRPLEEQQGAIVEVNACPGLRMHLEPSVGRPRPVGEAIVDLMFAPQENGRIPIVAVTGTNGKTTTTRFIAHLFALQSRCVGMTCTDGIFIDGRRIDAGDCSGPKSARSVLMNPRVEAAVLETARGGILREGLGFDLCDVAVVTNLADGDHLGASDIQTLEDLARVKRVVVEAVAPNGTAVLKANDPLVAAMAEKCPGTVIFFARSGGDPVLNAHRHQNGRVLFVRDGMMIAAEGAYEIPIISLERMPLTHRGRVGFQVENALAAAGAGWAAGMEFDTLRAGLESFSATLQQSPGRFNLLEIGDSTVIVDYGHNASALSALIEAVDTFPHVYRSIVYSSAGDRRDCDLIQQGELLGDKFDRVILYEDHYRRGRAEGEIMALIRRGLECAVYAPEIVEIHSALKAVEMALQTARPGELLVIQADVIDETVDFVRQYLHRRVPGREIDIRQMGGRLGSHSSLQPSADGLNSCRPSLRKRIDIQWT
jgi:cyanophycin synthetase